MKFKNSNKQTVHWRDHYMHHKDAGPTASRFGWRRPSNHVGEHDKSVAKAVFVSRYPEDMLRSFEEAARRCPTVAIDGEIMDGQPCLAGTRIPVRAVLRALEQYGSVEDVRRCYPHLTKTQVEDALYFSQLILELPIGLEETAPTP
jgi:uncharacterized protein (DUF433 family)